MPNDKWKSTKNPAIKPVCSIKKPNPKQQNHLLRNKYNTLASLQKVYLSTLSARSFAGWASLTCSSEDLVASGFAGPEFASSSSGLQESNA